MFERSGFLLRVVVVASFFALAVGVGPRLNAQEKPNLVLIVVDDLGVDAIEGEHWPNQLKVHTPQLSGFAQQGRSFTNVRMNPICSPSRAALLSGRQALQTGVTGLIGDEQPRPDRDLLSLQNEETTIAEVLKGAGYYTILADKWHVGFADDQLPPAQGFTKFIDGRDIWDLDKPEKIGDEHVTRLINLAVDAVNNRPVPDDPYAIFLWTKDPHKRSKDAKGLLWWIMDPALQPSGEDYYSEPESNLKRFRGNVEALDTELGRFLREINVVDADGRYRPESRTLVLFVGDNGTDDRVSAFGDQGKGTLYEGGIHVPCFAFGYGVSADGDSDDRLIGQVDFFDTIADYAGIAADARGDGPRDGVSFADALGAPVDPPHREYVLSSEPRPDINKHSVALTGTRYKLITRAGGPGYHKVDFDEFYDLQADPLEQHNLINKGIDADQAAAYAEMRDAIVDYWNASVIEPFQDNDIIDRNLLPLTVDIPADRVMTLFSDDSRSPKTLYVGYSVPRKSGDPVEARIFCDFDLRPLRQILLGLPRLPRRVSAQVILQFSEDAGGSNDADTPPVAAAPMTVDPFDANADWASLKDAHGPLTLGQLDPAPHIITDPDGTLLRGVPLPPGTPVSLGQSVELRDLVGTWLTRPKLNRGLVVLPETGALPQGGRQFIVCEPNVILRVTIYDWK